MNLGVLHKHLRIVREGDRLFIPTTTRVDLDFPAEQREFGEGFVAVRSYKDVVEVPAPLRRSLPSSFDVIGDIAVLKIPNELKRYREEIGRAILRWNPTLRVVVEDHGVRGKRRVRSIEVIAGERRTTTVHTEHGLRYAVDLAHAFEALGARGVVHVYRILKRADERAAADRIRAIAAHAGMEVKDLRLHTVRAYSPTQHHVAFDVTVARASRPAGPGTSPSVSRRSRMKATPTTGRRSGRTVRRSARRGPRRRRSTRRR